MAGYSATTGATLLRVFAGITAGWFILGGIGAILLGIFGGVIVGTLATSSGNLGGGGPYGALPLLIGMGGVALVAVGLVGFLHFLAGLLHLVSRRTSAIFPAIVAILDGALFTWWSVASFQEPDGAAAGVFILFWALVYFATGALFLTPAVRY